MWYDWAGALLALAVFFAGIRLIKYLRYKWACRTMDRQYGKDWR